MINHRQESPASPCSKRFRNVAASILQDFALRLNQALENTRVFLKTRTVLATTGLASKLMVIICRDRITIVVDSVAVWASSYDLR